MNDIEDQCLRDRLAAADPGAGLDVLSGAARAAVLERVLERDSAGVPVRPAAGWAAGAAARRPADKRVTRVGAGLIALASAAAVLTGLLLAVPPGVSAARVLTLRASAAATSGMCLRLDDFAPQALAESSVALEGTVTSTSDGTVQVRPERFFRGGPADRVDLTTAPRTVEDATVFRLNERVLIAAAGKDVIGCGLSGQATSALRTYYSAAFNG